MSDTKPRKLKDYFPLIRERNELLREIENDPRLLSLFDSWNAEQQQEFLDFCTGSRGVKLLYDSFFKEIMNPETTPERLERFLSLLLGTNLKILMVLPNDSTRIADEKSLLITDIVVQMEDGSLANLEVQKVGYMFPGERSACYSADLLLRQYKRIRSEKKKMFSYRDIKTVYMIVLFEQSPSEFSQFPQDYCHYFESTSNTGLKLNLLQKHLFIPLDIFRKIQHNKDITSELDAWLVFFGMDEPEMIIKLITAYPEFKPMYEQVYALCRNIEGVMNMFSEELRELDRNTVNLMIDEMQATINRQKAQLEENQRKHEEDQRKHEEDQRLLQEALAKIAELNRQLNQ